MVKTSMMASTGTPSKNDSPRKVIIISSLQGIKNAQITALREYKKRDILVYNAFIRSESPFSFASAISFQKILNIEVVAMSPIATNR